MQEQRRARMREVFGFIGEDASSLSALDEAFSVYLAGYEDGWACFPDVAPMLSQLAGHDFGVISNGDPDQQRSR